MLVNSPRFTSETQFNGTRKLIGSPLVTCIPRDSTKKVDIYAAVSAALAPFVRAKVHPPGDSVLNGSGPSLDGIVLTENGASCEKGLSTSNVDEAITDAELLPFKLYLSDDKGHVRNPIEEDSNHVLGQPMRLLMDWSYREHEIYNLKYMDDLPDVFKPGFMSKKTRQEAVNLFSCLDAFLKDEPLGPDDMWLVYFPALLFVYRYRPSSVSDGFHCCLASATGTVLAARSTDRPARNLTCGGCLRYWWST